MPPSARPVPSRCHSVLPGARSVPPGARRVPLGAARFRPVPARCRPPRRGLAGGAAPEREAEVLTSPALKSPLRRQQEAEAEAEAGGAAEDPALAGSEGPAECNSPLIPATAALPWPSHVCGFPAMPSLAGSGRTGGREAHKMKTLMVSALLARLIPAPAAGRRAGERRAAELPRAPCTRSSLGRAASPRLSGIARRRPNLGGGGKELSACFLLFVLLVVRGFCVCVRFQERTEKRSA